MRLTRRPRAALLRSVARVPKAVSDHFAKMAQKANRAMRGTDMAKERAQKAAKARWKKK